MSRNSRSTDAVLQDAVEICNVQISRGTLDVVKNAQGGGELGAWIEKTLKPQNLLSSEELKLYKILQKHGLLSRADGRDVAFDRFPVKEANIKAATKSLEASTRAIEVQNNALRSQKALLNAQRNASRAASENADAFIASLDHRKHVEAQTLDFENEEKSHQLYVDLQELLESSQRCIKTAPSVIIEQLKKDDRNFEHLLASHVSCLSNSAESSSNTKSEELLKLLNTILTQEIETRLDRIYLATLGKPPSSVSEAGDVDAKLLTTMESDLGSLYSEIEDVVSISVRQEFGEPLQKSLHEAQMHRDARQQHLEEHLERDLGDMTATLNNLADKLESATSSQMTVYTILRHLEALKQIALHTRDAKVPAKNLKLDAPRPAEQAMLRHFGIIEQGETESGVLSALESKVEKLRELCNGSEDEEENELTSAMSARQGALEVLKDASSERHDPLRDSLEVLEKKTMGLQAQLEILASEQDKPVDAARQRLVERWT